MASKKDEGKNRLDLWPPDVYEEIGKVLTYGATKYASRAWEEGMRWGSCYAALQRHLQAWWRGESTDPETGYSHLAHASCCLIFLLAYELRGIGVDDRHKLTQLPKPNPEHPPQF